MISFQLLGIPIIYYIIAAAIVLPRIPLIGKFFNIINTIFHELGHALMTLVFEGNVRKIEIFSDTSGATTTQCKSKIGTFFIAISGYPFAAICSYGAFKMITAGYPNAFIWILCILLFFILIFWVRNFYGILWILLFCALNGYLFYLNEFQYIELAGMIYATFMAVESVVSSLVILFLSIARSQNAGDATILKKITGIPAFIWGICFCSFSIFMGYLIVKNFNFLFY